MCTAALIITESKVTVKAASSVMKTSFRVYNFFKKNGFKPAFL